VVQPYRLKEVLNLIECTCTLFNTVSKWWKWEPPAVVIRSNADLETGCLGVCTVKFVRSAKMVVSDPTSDHGTKLTKDLGIRPQDSGNSTAPHFFTIRAGDGCKIGVRSP